jgi:hypothetical protein
MAMYTRLRIAAIIGTLALSVATGRAQRAPGDPTDGGFQIRYAANLIIGDSYVNFTNEGASSTATGLETAGFQNGNLCVNVYTYSPDEQLVSCCSCQMTPNAIATLSVNADLVANTLTPIRPSAAVVKLMASAGSTTGACNAATVTRVGANPLRPGLLAWGTTLHALPVTAGTPPGTYGVTETPFSRASLSDAELIRMTQLCAFIQANGSGYGICKSCRFGGLGAATK